MQRFTHTANGFRNPRMTTDYQEWQKNKAKKGKRIRDQQSWQKEMAEQKKSILGGT